MLAHKTIRDKNNFFIRLYTISNSTKFVIFFKLSKIVIFEKRAQVQNMYLTDLYSIRKMRLFTDKLRWLTVINGNVQHKACGALQLANAVLTGLD